MDHPALLAPLCAGRRGLRRRDREQPKTQPLLRAVRNTPAVERRQAAHRPFERRLGCSVLACNTVARKVKKACSLPGRVTDSLL